MGSSPDNDGTDQHRRMVRVRLARQKGVREEPATESSSRQPSGSNLADRGRAATRTRTAMLMCVMAVWLVYVAGREATVNACGVAVAMLQGHSWTLTLSNGWEMNVGTIPPAPFTGQQLPGRREGLLPADAGGMGRRTRSSPRPGKPVTWRRGPVCSQQTC